MEDTAMFHFRLYTLSPVFISATSSDGRVFSDQLPKRDICVQKIGPIQVMSQNSFILLVVADHL